jgi:hypothetical protein
MLGLRGKNRREKLANYFDDMSKVLSEMYRVLRKVIEDTCISLMNVNIGGGFCHD